MTGVTLAQLEALAARAPARASSSAGRRALTAGDVYERARRYLETVPPAISGQHGHDRTFYVANRLVRGFGLSPADAYPLFHEWSLKSPADDRWSEHDLRRKLDQAARQPGPRGFLLTTDPIPPGAKGGSGCGTGKAPRFRNFTTEEYLNGDTMASRRVGRRGEEMVDELTRYTGGWPRRMGRMLFALDRAGDILWMKTAAELFAWIDWQYGVGDGKGYEWAGGPSLLSMETFLAACRTHCEHWDQVELHPHEPLLPGHYYHHPEIVPGDGKHLTELVCRFSPATDLDGDLIRLFFLSMCWGGPPGKRPVFVIESASRSKEGGRGAGKTTLASFAASLVGGYVLISPGEQIRDIHARLLSPEGMVRRVGLIDNLKSLRFSNSDLEGLVTSEVISGRQMYTGEGRRPNTLQWVITSNMPSLSKDLAQRSVIIRVNRPVYDPAWQKDVAAFVAEHRWKIVGDAVAELRKAGQLPATHQYTRWAEWEQDVLAKAPEPERLAAEINLRQGLLDDDKEQADDLQDAIREMVRKRGFNPETDKVLIPAQELFDEVVKKHNSDRHNRSSGLRWLYTVGVPSLSKWEAELPYRGGLWTPQGASDDSKMYVWSDRLGI